jgi:ATP-dependent protease Clp ATPase subunit
MFGGTMRCSFCLRKDSEVVKLVAGPMKIFGRVYICDRCAAQTIEIMEAPAHDSQPRGERQSLLRRIVNRLVGGRRHASECHAV